MNVFIMLLWLNFVLISADSGRNYTKIENPSNLYVGAKHIHRIKEFFINEDMLSCTIKHLPIYFVMQVEEKKQTEVTGLMTEHGNLVHIQENTTCFIYRKFYVNDEYVVLLFDSKIKVVPTSLVYRNIYDTLYQAYFITWVFFRLGCYDETLGDINALCAWKETWFWILNGLIGCFLTTIWIQFVIRQYENCLCLQQLIEEKLRQQREIDAQRLAARPKPKRN